MGVSAWAEYLYTIGLYLCLRIASGKWHNNGLHKVHLGGVPEVSFIFNHCPHASDDITVCDDSQCHRKKYPRLIMACVLDSLEETSAELCVTLPNVTVCHHGNDTELSCEKVTMVSEYFCRPVQSCTELFSTVVPRIMVG